VNAVWKTVVDEFEVKEVEGKEVVVEEEKALEMEEVVEMEV